MDGRPLVLTRQPAQAGTLEADLAAAGRRVGFCPLTDFELPPTPGGLRAVVEAVVGGRCAWLLVTSPNAVRALQAAGWTGAVGAGVRVAVTGAGTARVLAAAGCAVEPWMPESASAAGMLAEFPAAPVETDDDARRVLLPQSALATAELEEALTRRGWAVDRVEAYRTVPYPADAARRLLTEEPGDAGTVVPVGELAGADVVLTSPSAARALAVHPALDDPELRRTWRLVALGAPTAREARRLGLRLTGQAATPDATGILAALARPVG